ncbi:hypothetical protein Celaphus_00016862 [Cervus elaphus hippelaphus]|uniref:Large ribosomal subunit protein eL22 n=1 Tax=Cervus elaphus hippelaphus TaxID=46360 RepID=A0A212C402_CEREH|nr:hypothetical protein Celaphus_00016862 [Cervus elaphus hippelaphus]
MPVTDATKTEPFLQERIKVNGNGRNLGSGVTTVRKKPKQDHFANSKEAHKLRYFQINQDKEEEENEN